MNIGIVTKQIREGYYYRFQIRAVGERTRDGKLKCPVIEFFQSENDVHHDGLSRLSALLEFSARHGPPNRNKTKFKQVEGSNGIFEFKEYQHRLLCFYDVGNIIVCTNGLVKKGDKLPRPAIESAENWKRLYFVAQSKNQLYHEQEHP